VIQQVARDHVSCLVERVVPSDYRPYPLVLVQGLAKGDKPDRMVAEATALGAERVAFVHAARGVARPDAERAEVRRQRWLRIAAEAARQSGRGDLPAIDGPGELDSVLQELAGSCCILLQPGAPPLLPALHAWAAGTSLALLVGPEGGFDDRELESADRVGVRPASLGAGVLRTELAGSAALAVGVAFAQAHGMISRAKDR
jgi:16S rRNA (uracil1498-N3)-methyltransferase